MKWEKINNKDLSRDGDYLVIKKDSKLIEHLVFNSHQKCWDDCTGDDFECSLDSVAYFMPFPDIPEELIQEA